MSIWKGYDVVDVVAWDWPGDIMSPTIVYFEEYGLVFDPIFYTLNILRTYYTYNTTYY